MGVCPANRPERENLVKIKLLKTDIRVASAQC